MFKRINYEDWHEAVPVVAFILTFGVFVIFFVRAMRLQGDEAGRMASLPLDLDEAQNNKEVENDA